jgi:hypothetical protein
MEPLLPIDLKKYPLLHGGVKIGVPHLPRIPRLLIGVLVLHGD